MLGTQKKQCFNVCINDRRFGWMVKLNRQGEVTLLLKDDPKIAFEEYEHLINGHIQKVNPVRS